MASNLNIIEGNVFFIELIALQKPGAVKELTVFYGGKPKWLSTRHGTENYLEKRQQWKPFIASSCQG
jgi:hypothetical protein